jgi:2-polyprenyl-3-methyl-5-hydroxy-6-metoxy-1,4-benzoquinol methylase
VNDAPARLNADGSDQDDWDDHWDKYGEAAKGNPANDYRHAMVLRLLGPLPKGAVVLDIGSGQGQFAIDVQEANPQAAVFGVEYSAEGVQRARRLAEQKGVPAIFFERNLLEPSVRDPELPLATHAVCSEVLEHVDDPVTLMSNAISLLAPGAKVVVTVPGGPRSAFDKHIGHFRHFTAPLLHQVLTEAGLDVDRVLRTGFPFFNVYKLAVIARGQKLVDDMEHRKPGAQPSGLEKALTSFFSRTFPLNRDDARLGWQLAAVAHVPLVS